jgi:hypothetical protein
MEHANAVYTQSWRPWRRCVDFWPRKIIDETSESRGSASTQQSKDVPAGTNGGDLTTRMSDIANDGMLDAGEAGKAGDARGPYEGAASKQP